MRVRFLFILMVSVVVAGNAYSQQKAASPDTVIKSNTIEIIQSYKPEVKQAPKPEFAPSLPPADTAKPAYNYEVPQQALYYTYNSIPLRPLALGKDTAIIPFANYVKLGAGNLSTIYLDAGIGSLSGKDYTTAIHVHHISQKGDVNFQQSALTGLEADGSLHRNGNIWHAFVDGERNQYNYYGYDHNYTENSDSLKQTFLSLKGGVDMQNENYGYKNLNYHPSVFASLYSDKYSAEETTIGINAPVSYDIDTSLQLNAGINGTFTQLNVNSASKGNNIVQLVAGAVFHNSAFIGHAYIDPTLGEGSNFYVLPDLAAGYKSPKGLFTATAGWQSLLHQNTYEQLSTLNPYMVNTYDIRQTKSDEVYADIESNLGKHVTLSGRLSWWQYGNLPLFLNNMGDQRLFYIVYDDKLNATSFRIAARYQVANTFAVGLNGTFYSYYDGTQRHAWEEPTAKLKGDLLFRPLPSLTITGYLTYLDGMYALNTNNQDVKLNGYFDIGGNIEYNIIPRLSVFVQVTNLLNNRNQRWFGYDSYGANIYGGIRLKF